MNHERVIARSTSLAAVLLALHSCTNREPPDPSVGTGPSAQSAVGTTNGGPGNTGSGAASTVGPNNAVPIPVDIVVKHPETHEPIKRFHIKDARFTLPGYSARVQTKLTMDLPFESDGGSLIVHQDA